MSKKLFPFQHRKVIIMTEQENSARGCFVYTGPVRHPTWQSTTCPEASSKVPKILLNIWGIWLFWYKIWKEIGTLRVRSLPADEPWVQRGTCYQAHLNTAYVEMTLAVPLSTRWGSNSISMWSGTLEGTLQETAVEYMDLSPSSNYCHKSYGFYEHYSIVNLAYFPQLNWWHEYDQLQNST